MTEYVDPHAPAAIQGAGTMAGWWVECECGWISNTAADETRARSFHTKHLTQTSTKKEAPTMTTGTIALVDPTTLTIAMNVRTDVRLDPLFVESIREVGILQPPMVTVNADGGYDVVLGQRRTLAAVEAGLTEIPVYVVEQTDAEAARLIDQITENEQRQSLTDSERVAGYKQLSLFGVTPAQIAKRTATSRKDIDTALSIANNEAATTALVDHQVTLDQAAAIAGFDGDKAAVKKLTTAAEKEPARFDHVVADLQRKRDLDAHRVELRAQLAESGVTVLADADGAWAGTAIDEPAVTRLDQLALPQTPTEALTYDDIKDKTQLAGRIIEVWNHAGPGKWATIQYFLLDTAASKYTTLQNAWQARTLTPEEQAAKVAREIEENVRAKHRAALAEAATVRDAWITQFLQRRTVPSATKFVALSLTYGEGLDGIGEDSASLRWLRADITPGDDGELDVRRSARRTASPSAAAAEKLILAVVLEHHEDNLAPSYRRTDPEQAALYLAQLAEWGYGLSAVEQEIVDEQAAA